MIMSRYQCGQEPSIGTTWEETTNGLRKTIAANAVFSASSGAILLLGAGSFDGAFGLEAWLLVAVGASLVAYGAGLGIMVRLSPLRQTALTAAAMDFTWVGPAAVVLIGFETAMTTSGRVSLLLVSLIVGGFALAQVRGSLTAAAPSGMIEVSLRSVVD